MAASLSKEELLDVISNMSVMQVVELVEAMEEKFGVSAAMAAPVVVSGAPAAAAQEEQTEFTVVLASFGENKVNVIKAIREITGLGLKEAKDLVEGAPSTVKEAVNKEEAETIKKKLTEAGAKVDIK